MLVACNRCWCESVLLAAHRDENFNAYWKKILLRQVSIKSTRILSFYFASCSMLYYWHMIGLQYFCAGLKFCSVWFWIVGECSKLCFSGDVTEVVVKVPFDDILTLICRTHSVNVRHMVSKLKYNYFNISYIVVQGYC